MDKYMLLPMRGRGLNPRFTPAFAPRSQLNSQRLHELGIAKDPPDQGKLGHGL
jgi:hypothetical protein